MKNPIEKLGREADRAVWALEVAESIRDVVMTVVANHERTPGADLRKTMGATLGTLVAKYERQETQAVSRFVEAIQARLQSTEVRR